MITLRKLKTNMHFGHHHYLYYHLKKNDLHYNYYYHYQKKIQIMNYNVDR